MKIRPIHDRVIVKRLEEERKTASGIVIPDTVRNLRVIRQREYSAAGERRVAD